MVPQLKMKLFYLLHSREQKGLFLCKFILIVPVVLSGLTLAANTFLWNEAWRRIWDGLDALLTGWFLLEYLTRLWTADLNTPSFSPAIARLRYAISPMGLIDLCAFLPNYIARGLHVQNLWIFDCARLIKAGRWTASLSKLTRVVKLKGREIILTMGVVLAAIFIAALFMFYVEHAAQPVEFHNIFSALWWSVVTLTTVGYGDICPITPLGKLLSALISLLGIGLIALPTGIISAGFIELNDGKRKYRSYCPYCGKKIEYEEKICDE